MILLQRHYFKLQPELITELKQLWYGQQVCEDYKSWCCKRFLFLFIINLTSSVEWLCQKKI